MSGVGTLQLHCPFTYSVLAVFQLQTLVLAPSVNGGVTPEGNRTVLWVWRGSLKGDSGGQGGLGKHGKGLNLVQPCVKLTDNHH